MNILLQYPYLICSLMLFICPLFAFIFFPKRRKFMLISGLASMDASISAFLFDISYWNPKRIFGGGFGIEDVLFTFSISTVIAFLAAMFFKLNIIFDKKIFLKRYFIWAMLKLLILFIIIFLALT